MPLLKLERQSSTHQKLRCIRNCSDNNRYQQMEACIAATMAALACKYVNQQNKPSNHGNAIQNAAPEIAPRRERSVRCGKELLACIGIDFLNLFHIFSPFLRCKPKHFAYSIPLFSYFGKSFLQSFCVFCKTFLQSLKSKGVFHITNTVKALPNQVSVL